MLVMDNKSIMYSGVTYDIDPNFIIGSERWSYALYITIPSITTLNYDNIWKNTHSKSSITYYKSSDKNETICEIEAPDDMLLLRLYLDELLHDNINIEYTYIIKRVEDSNVKLYCDNIKEYIHDKKDFIEYMCLVMT